MNGRSASRSWERATPVARSHDLDAILQQDLAVLLEPTLRPLDRAVAERAGQRPEARTMVEMHEMGDLVRHQIIQHLRRSEDQPPRERQGGVGTAASPP